MPVDAALDHLTAAAPDRRLLIIVHTLGLGGVSVLYGSVAGEAVRRGWAVVVAGVRDEDAARVDWGGAHLAALADWDAHSLPALDALAGAATITAMAITPDTAPLAPLVAHSGRAVLSIHGAPDLMCDWLGTRRLEVLRAVAGSEAHVGFMVPGPPYLAPQRAMIGGEPDAWSWMPHATAGARHAVARRQDAPATTEVLCAQRLAEEKRPGVRAAAEVARAAGARLTVVGVGRDVEWVHEYLGGWAGLKFRVVEDPDLTPWIAGAEVVVGTGLVALEALAAGACTVGVSLAGDGHPWAPATPATWAMLHRQNFAGLDERPLTGAEVWRRLGAMTAADRADLAALVRRDAAPGAALDAVLAAARPAPARPLPRLTRALLAGVMSAERERREVPPYIEEVTAARDWHRDQAGRLAALWAERSEGAA